MVGISLEESTISESSLDASTAPTTATSRSTMNLSHDSLPPSPSPTYLKHPRIERSSTVPAERLVKDLSYLLRSNSRLKCDSYIGSQTVLHPLPEDSRDHACHHSDYAHNLSQNPSKLSRLDLELHMLRERDTEKVKRSENKFYGFLRRGRLASRSAPKKRRSRSVDEIAEMAEPLQSTISLANGGHSVEDHGPTFASPPIRHGGIPSSSRPLSTATVTQKHLDKKLPQLPPDTTTSTHQPLMSSTHVTSEPEHPKHRKKTFFGMITLPGSRRSSISKSRPASPRSSTPDNTFNPHHQRKPDLAAPSPPPCYHDLSSIPLNDTTNYRWNGDVAGQRSQPSFDISEPDSGLGIETVVAKTKLVTIVSSQPRPHLEPIPDVPIRASSTPPKVAHGVEKSGRTLVDETERLRPPDPSTSGRRSPLMVLANSKMFGGKKGKERERSVDRGRDARIVTPVTAQENEKGRESRGTDQERGRPNTNISGPMNIKVARGRVKHGSFDFERPLSTSAGYPVRRTRWNSSASYRTSSETDKGVNGHGNGHLWNGPGSSTYPIQEERSSLTRNRSVRDSGHYHQDPDRGQTKIRFADETKGTQTRSRSPHDARSRTQPQHQHSAPPSKSTGLGLGLFKSAKPSSAQTNPPYRPEGGSWGRNTSNRVGLGTGYVDGLPSFAMSATSLHLNGDANGPSSRSNSPQIVTLPMDRVTMKKHTGKGRSLDLGLELNWAPTRLREEAVMDFSEMGVRSRWREEAEMKDLYRMKVLESFERVLGENGYAKFKEYVQRFDSRLMPLDGPSGLTHKVRRLLDTSAKGLDAKKKQELLERLDRVVQHPR